MGVRARQLVRRHERNAIGVGLPMLSGQQAIMLWKYTVVRRPPFHHVEYDEPSAS